MTNEGVFLYLSFYENDKIELVLDELIGMLPFKKVNMRSAFSYKKQRYNGTVFKDSFAKAASNGNRFSTTISTDYSNSICIRYDSIAHIFTVIMHTNQSTDCIALEQGIDSISELIPIVSAVLRNRVDSHINSSLEPEIYKTFGIDTDNLKLIYSPTLHKDIVDIEQFSGHGHECGGILFTSAFLMWYGVDFFRFIPQDILQSFSECWKNETLKNGTVKIQLYADIADYQSELAIKRQWAFREFANIDKVAEDWHSEYYAIAATDHSSANMEILTGVFPHGGVRQVRMYLDKDGQNATKKNASKYVYKEYDSSGKVISEGECNTEND